MILLPDEIIRHILEFNADFHPNLLACHKEMLEDPPYYWKKVIGGFKPGIGEHATWYDFKRNERIRMNYDPTIPQWEEDIYLHAIEITPKHNEHNSRFIYLYYGWKRRKNFNWCWTTREIVSIRHNSATYTYLGTY